MNERSICFMDSRGKVILEKKVTSLPLREETVIAKSIEFFNDPEPCMIHRSAVMKRLYIEINDFLSNALQSEEKQLAWISMPTFIKSYINVPNVVDYVFIKSS